MMVVIASRCVAKWPSLSMRWSSGLIFCGLNTLLWIFWGLLFKIDLQFLFYFFAIFCSLVRSDFLGFTSGMFFYFCNVVQSLFSLLGVVG